MDTNFYLNQSKEALGEYGKYETLFALQNGYISVRGVNDLQEDKQSPATFIAGVFDKSTLLNSIMVANPYLLGYEIYIGEEKITLDHCDIITFNRYLNMFENCLYGEYTLATKDNKQLHIKEKKFVSANDKHLSAVEVQIEPLNFSGIIKICSTMDLSISNYDVNSNQQFKVYTLKEENQLSQGLVKTCTVDGHYTIQSRINCETNFDTVASFLQDETKCAHIFAIEGIQNQVYCLRKTVYTYSTRDVEEDELVDKLLQHMAYGKQQGFDVLFNEHKKVMAELWQERDIQIEGDDELLIATRFNVLTLMVLGKGFDTDVNIGAKGLHGDGYCGRVFWDTEIFLLPYYIYTDREAAKNLMVYRLKRLAAAKENAKALGSKGAKYPWQCSDTGLEECPDSIVLTTGEVIPVPDVSMQLHITSDVIYGLYSYYKATKDESILQDGGYEAIYQSVVYWLSVLQYNEVKDQYEILNVKGPDEFHISVDNNFYTNYLVQWNILWAIECFTKHPEMGEAYGITQEMLDEWQGIAHKIDIPEVSGVIEQYNGFFNLKDYVIKDYDEKGMPILPESFRIEEDYRPYTLLKQPDVLMLMYMFKDRFSKEQKLENFKYYEARTVHKSSLSPCIHALVGLDVDDYERAYEYFKITVCVDLVDNQKNTYQGIHAASQGGAWQDLVMGFGGFAIEDEAVHLKPWLPAKWDALAYQVVWCDRRIKVRVEQAKLTVIVESEKASETKVVYKDTCYHLKSGVVYEL